MYRHYHQVEYSDATRLPQMWKLGGLNIFKEVQHAPFWFGLKFQKKALTPQVMPTNQETFQPTYAEPWLFGDSTTVFEL